jgi:predicted MFS family arabinose efflux permease
MGAVTLVSRWCPGDRLSAVLSWIWAFGQVGIFLAATPLALASEAFGWRSAFAGMAVITAAAGIAFYLWVERSQLQAAAGAPESFGGIVRGLVAVCRTPGLVPVLAVHTFAYASMATVLGLWTGPFLSDVYGLDVTARGNVLLAMGVAQLAGILVYGQLDRLFDTRKWVIVAGTLGTIACLGALALVPDLTLAAAVTLLVAFCGVTAYALVIVAHGRSLFPDRLAGRGVTTVNIAQVAGLTVLAVATGAIVEAFSGWGVAAGYRIAFGAIAIALAGGLAVYLFAKDIKPSAARRASNSTVEETS